MEDDHLDVAFIRTRVPREKEIVFHSLLEEPMVAALPDGHALARGKAGEALTLKQLSDETFVVYRQHGAWAVMRDAVFAACRAAGFSPRVGQEAPHVISTLPFVAIGIGISIVPASLEDLNVRGVVYRSLKGGPLLKAPLNLASRRGDPSEVVRQFVALARRKAKGFDPLHKRRSQRTNGLNTSSNRSCPVVCPSLQMSMP